MSATHSATSPPTAAQQAEMLERILRAQLEGWRRMHGVIERQRDALRTADGPALEKSTLEQHQLAKSLVMLDQQRERLAAIMQKAILPECKQPAPVTQLIRRAAIDDEVRARLLVLADELRTTIETTRRRNAIVRDAADALTRHIAGIQQVVYSALSRARVYGRRGQLALGAATPAAVDMKS